MLKDGWAWWTILCAVAWFALAGLAGCSAPNEVINYRTYTDPDEGIFYVYDGVLDNAALTLGVGGDQTRVTISRLAH